METGRKLGFDPTNRELEKLGYEIESRTPDTGQARLTEVKGRENGAATVTPTRNETLYPPNKPEDFVPGIVQFLNDSTHRVHYVREPFRREPDLGGNQQHLLRLLRSCRRGGAAAMTAPCTDGEGPVGGGA